jgi:hypothetical protein
MTRALIATSVYEAARPYLDAWIDGVLAIRGGPDVSVLVTVDNLRHPESAFFRLTAALPVRFVTTDASSPAAVRLSMLKSIRAEDTDMVVLSDCDDVMLPQAIAVHAEALDGADFSAGDLDLIDVAGQPVTGHFFGSRNLLGIWDDWRWTLTGNPFGFTNTALAASAIPSLPGDIPSTITAVDWWLFATLLRRGCKARLVSGRVAKYRLHPTSVALRGIPENAAQFTAALSAVSAHLGCFQDDPHAASLRLEIERAKQMPFGAKHVTHAGAAGLWYEAVIDVARRMVSDATCVSH